MATLYLIEQNTVLRKSGNRLLLCRRPPWERKHGAVLQSDIILDLPCADVSQVMLFGNIQVTTQALQKMLKKGIELALFSYSGQLLGQLTPPMGKNIPLRMGQFRRFQDAEFTLRMAKGIVSGKISNALRFLQNFRKNHPAAFHPDELERMKQSIRKIEAVNNLESLRGIEGTAAAHYFSLFGKLINAPWTFKTRNKRPPRDPVNAVLSFGYVIAGTQLQALLDGIGLDPYLGFYHQIDYGRPSLALDLLEEFRHPLIDRLATILFNSRILKENDFFQHASGGIYLNTAGKQKFFRQYEKMLGEIASEENFTSQKGYFRIFQRQIQRLIQTIQEDIVYKPFAF